MSDKVLLIGSGSREHAIAWQLAKSAKISEIFVAPGNAGTQNCSSPKIRNVSLNLSDNNCVLDWCVHNGPALVVVGPEDPLANGISDVLTCAGFACFGPSKAAAQLEYDKSFAKNFMQVHGIPTADFRVFDDPEVAVNFLNKPTFSGANVVKASGLALGKGVCVASSRQEAIDFVNEVMVQQRYGSAGHRIVIEQQLIGDEISALAFSDGSKISLMPLAQDHKRAYFKDQGPNSGGMGALAPYPLADEQLIETIKKDIIQATVDAMAQDGKPFVGVLFVGIMITDDGPKVLEYNVRFGDPETQTILPLLQTDLYDIFRACSVQAATPLDQLNIKWNTSKTCVSVVIASGGYPATSTKGLEIRHLDRALNEQSSDGQVMIFHAATVYNDAKYFSNGGRLFSVVAICNNLQQSIQLSQRAAAHIDIDNFFYRTDIGMKTLRKYKDAQRL